MLTIASWDDSMIAAWDDSMIAVGSWRFARRCPRRTSLIIKFPPVTGRMTPRSLYR
jgi:hypothetical protein